MSSQPPCSRACRGYDEYISYGIVRDYVRTRNWGVWEGFRELVQNALDEIQYVTGSIVDTYPCTYSNGKTIIHDDGRGLGVNNLLIGKSEKMDWQRGRFGEGLKLGLMTLLDQGYKVRILTRDKIIVPKYETNIIEGTSVDLFCVCIKKSDKYVQGTTIEIESQTNLCREFRTRFVQGIDKNKILYDIVEDGFKRYTIIDKTGTDGKPRIYVRDIYVADITDIILGSTVFSYNVHNVRIDESRRVVNLVDLMDQIARIHAKVILDAYQKYKQSGGDDNLNYIIRELFRNCNNRNVLESALEHFETNLRREIQARGLEGAEDDLRKFLFTIWMDVYGFTLPLSLFSPISPEYARYLSINTILCKEYLCEFFSKFFETEKIIYDMMKEKDEYIPIEALPPHVSDIFIQLRRLASVIIPGVRSDNIVLQKMSDKVHGSTDINTGLIYLNYEQFIKRVYGFNPVELVSWFIRVVTHEQAHINCRCEDTSPEFVSELTYLLGSVASNMISKYSTILHVIDEIDLLLSKLKHSM